MDINLNEKGHKAIGDLTAKFIQDNLLTPE
jgi:hypothetical protein